jgi:hypothetical protein
VTSGNGYDERPLDYVRAERGSSVVLNIDRGAARAVVDRVLSALWWSSFFSAAAFIGLLATCFFIYKNIGYTAVLEYDLMDLRSKMGLAHENTPAPPAEGEQP